MDTLLDICGGLPVSTFAADEVLVEQGAPPAAMFVLISGTVVAERDGVAVADIETPGAVLGEMSVVLEKPATATIRARDDVRAYVVDEPERFFVDNPGAALAVLRITASRLDGMTQYLADVKQQLAGADGHLGMVGQVLDTLVHHQGPRVRTGSARDPEGTAGH